MWASASAIAVLAAFAAPVLADFDPTYYSQPFESPCPENTEQSPINVYGGSFNPAPGKAAADFKFPVVTNPKWINKGTTLQVEWDSYVDDSQLPTFPVGGDYIGAILEDPSIPVTKNVKIAPVQFHFHSPSEHTIDGLYYAAETHIVSIIAEGEAPEWGCDTFWQNLPDLPTEDVLSKCVAVFATMYKIGGSTPKWFDYLFDTASNDYGDEGELEVTEFDLNALIPGDLTYYTYDGSLTTPPCVADLRWTVFTAPLTITPATMQKMQFWLSQNTDGEATNEYRTNNRFIQPLDGRTIYYSLDTSSACPYLDDLSDRNGVDVAAVPSLAPEMAEFEGLPPVAEPPVA